jgi:hypothetical protein
MTKTVTLERSAVARPEGNAEPPLEFGDRFEVRPHLARQDAQQSRMGDT